MKFLEDIDCAFPKNLQEALKMMADEKSRGRPIAGGTDLMVQWSSGVLAMPERAIDLSGLAELKGVSETTDAVVIGAAVTVLFHNPLLGAVIAMAMMTNILIAGLAGVFVPLTLERLKVDPAISSSIFVTMTTDSMGFLAFLGLATISGLVS